MDVTFAANPEMDEVDELPPVIVPVVDMFPAVYAISFPVRVQLLFTRVHVGDAEVPVLT